MGLAQILFTRTEDYAAVNTTVNFFEGRLKKWRGLSNAILRKIIREENYKDKKYELRLNVPNWLYKVWKKQYGEKNTEKIIGYIFKEPTLDLKIKKDFDFWKKEIRGEQIAYNTLRLNKSGDLKKISGYKEGVWWVQNIAAQIPVKLMGNIKNEKVLDLCAAPGGKTAQLFGAAAQSGAIVANGSLQQVKAAFDYGYNVGLAFQIIDDIMDYSSSNTQMGKNQGDDFKLGKTTLPIILAWEKSNKLEQEFFIKSLQELKQEKNDFEKCCEILKKYSILNQCKTIANGFVIKAIDALNEFSENDYKKALIELANSSLSRDN